MFFYRGRSWGEIWHSAKYKENFSPLQTSFEIKQSAVLGLNLAVTDYSGVVSMTRRWLGEIEAGAPRVRAVGAANTHFVTLSRRDAAFRQLLEGFDMIVPDGMPLVWVLNRHGAGMQDRVYGPTMMLRVIEALEEVPHFFMGGSPEMLQKLEANLKTRFPRLKVAGTHSPPFGPWGEEEDALIREKIARSGAKIVWIGLGCPKQETWLARNKPHLPPGVYFAVGAAFPFHSGMVKQAPAWMQKRGLEWLFRLVAEPRRLWRRYLVFNTLFLFYLLVDSLRKGRV